jgi:hypothetical protein
MALVTRENLGAWLLRCNPVSKWDLAQFVNDGHERIHAWSVKDDYRANIIEPGDVALLWTTGTHPIYRRGIWGWGHVTDYTQTTLSDDEGDAYWFDQLDRESVKYQASVDILIGNPLLDDDLRASGIDDLEVQRQKQGSNPSWVSKAQLARIEHLRGAVPPFTEGGQTITVRRGGAGFGTPKQNKLIEAAAMNLVKNLYRSRQWDCKDVSDENLGWDITFTRDDQIAHVEVKGVGGARPVALLTANELHAAEVDDDWILVVVTNALQKPSVHHFTAAQVLESAKPYVFKSDLSTFPPITFYP